MPPITTTPLTDAVGVQVDDIDVERLRTDEDLPEACLAALEQHGVLLFPQLHADDETQAAFCRSLGELVQFPLYPNPDVMEISFDPGNPNAEYFASNDFWHLDGFMDEVPAKASIMSAHVVTDEGGETAFASTYLAYDDLSADEKRRYENLRVMHSFERIQRLTYADPTSEQLDEWARRGGREHPLVWTHESGRRSLVFGASADYVVGMDVEQGRALLQDLIDRATAPDKVLTHRWTVGDMVIWDNTGLVHRACPFDRAQPRRMHRSTLVGQEPIK